MLASATSLRAPLLAPIFLTSHIGVSSLFSARDILKCRPASACQHPFYTCAAAEGTLYMGPPCRHSGTQAQ
ncbi:hypothetical protein BC835DRAFT_9110 [Cytidiella melzeri]|nr:hypothetical protein BC835DRAFT_9110 [Cytidiella melzeri]